MPIGTACRAVPWCCFSLTSAHSPPDHVPNTGGRLLRTEKGRRRKDLLLDRDEGLFVELRINPGLTNSEAINAADVLNPAHRPFCERLGDSAVVGYLFLEVGPRWLRLVRAGIFRCFAHGARVTVMSCSRNRGASLNYGDPWCGLSGPSKSVLKSGSDICNHRRPETSETSATCVANARVQGTEGSSCQ